MINKNVLPCLILLLIGLVWSEQVEAQWNTNGSSIVYTTDRVGIGTSTPGRRLHIKTGAGSGDAEALLFESAHTIGARMRFKPSATGGRLWDVGATANGATGEGGGGRFFIRDGSAGATRMIIDSNGRMGLGMTTPSYKLDVCGTIRSKEVLVETGWCDFVFETDYRLPSLAEEAAHIKDQGHLLGFESALAMDNKIHLTDVTKRQQVKIEELMLHLIALDKKVTQLEMEKAQLAEKVNALSQPQK